MKRTVMILCAAAILVATGILFSASSLQAPSGSWIVVGPMNSARSGASAVLLQDGRILVTGGNDSNGPSSTAEFFGANGSFSMATPMNVPRSGHVAVDLQDGRVLVAGGTISGGASTNSAEIYDPVANTWTNVVGGMVEARSSATSAVLQDGRVLIAGGQNGTAISSTIEIFDPSLGAFTPAGMMSSPRTQHAMTVLTDGRVLIVGGSNGTAPVDSTDIFDPVAGVVGVGPSLSVARFGHSATTLLNGQVVVIGGNNGNTNAAQMDVTPAEVVDFTAATPAFTKLAINLATPREGHLAFLLPNNNNVLIVGGTSAGATVASAELFTPQESPQGVWAYSFGLTGSMATARSNATGAPNQVSTPSSVTQRNGVLLVAGGNGANGNPLNSAEAFGFPTVQTDQSDYPPGTAVTITGSGFQAGETVTIQLVESPLIDTHGPYTVTADPNGNISDSSFVTDSHDLNVRFYLTASGGTSGSQAQNTFTDKTTFEGLQSIGAQTPSPVAQGSSATYLITLFSNGSGTCSATLSITTVLTGSTTSFSTNPVTLTGGTGTSTLTVQTSASTPTGTTPFTIQVSAPNVNGGSGCTGGTFTTGQAEQPGNPTLVVVTPTTTTLATSGTPSTYGNAVTFTATVTRLGGSNTPTGTVNFFDGANKIGTAGLVLVSGQDTANFGTSTLSAGTHTITAVYVGDSNFGGSTSSGLSQVVNQKSVTPSVTANNKTYDGTTTATATCSLTGVLAGDVGNVSCAAANSTFADKNVGNGKTVTATGIAISGTAAGNYQLSSTSATTTANITAVTLSVTGITASNKVYDGGTTATLNTSGAALSAVLGGDSGNVSLVTTSATGSFASKNAGTGITVTVSGLSLTGSAAGNYQLPTPQATTTANITPLTVSVSGITASNKVYDGGTTATLNTSGAALSAVLGGDSGNVSLVTTSATGSFASKNAGTGITVTVSGLSLTGSAAGNYQFPTPQATTTANITPLTVSVSGITASNKVYDGGTTATLNTSGAGLNGVIGSDNSNVKLSTSGATGTFASKNVGTGITVTVSGLTLTGSLAGNYQLPTPQQTTTANITPLTITGIFTASNKVYDGTTAASITTRTLSGVIVPDVVSLTGGTASFSDKNVANGKTVTVTGFTLSGTDAGNYQLASTTLTTTANITPAPLTVTAVGVNKVYDATTAATVTLSDNHLGSDVVTDSYTSASFANKNVGNGKTVNVTGISISGTDAGNYTLSNTTANTTANITPASLTVTAVGVNKVYDATTAATVTLSDNHLGSDVVTDSYTSASFANKNVGNGKTVNVTGISISGTDAGNYTLSNTTANTTANITPASLTVTAVGVNKVYDATTAATVTLSDNRVSSDVFGDSYTSASFADANAGTSKTVTVTGISISGADAGNYTFNTTATTTANITTATPLVTVSGGPFTYDGNPHSATVVATGVNSYVVPGTFIVTYTPPGNSTIPVNAANYFVSAIFSSNDPNYGPSTGSGTLTVNPAATSTSVNSSLNPSNYGDLVTFTAIATNTSTGATPTGVLALNIDGSPMTATVTSSGNTMTASYSTAALTVAGSPHSVVATYTNSDGNFSGSGGSLSGEQTVNQATTGVTISSSASSTVLGQAVAFTATIADTSSGSTGTPTGIVYFYDGAKLIGSATLNQAAESDHASFTTALLSDPVYHSITAVYKGDSNFSASPSSSAITQTVTTRPTSTAVALLPATVAVGISSTATITVTDTFTTGPSGTPGSFAPVLDSLSTPRTGQAAVLLPNGTVLLIGGKDSSGNLLFNMEIYDPSTNTFMSESGKFAQPKTPTNCFPTTCTGASATLLNDGTILIVGGSRDGTPAEAFAGAAIYDSVANSLTPLPGLATARFNHTATLLPNGNVLIAGGEDSTGTALSSTEIYTPSTQLFTPGPGPLSVARAGLTSTLLPSGKILMAGGSGLKTAELYDPTTGTSVPTSGNMSVDRTNHTATLMLDGNVLVAGGTSSGASVNTIEIYNTAVGTFTSVASTLTTARSGQTATMLDDGHVLMLGGTDATTPTPLVLGSAETYTPSFDPLGTVPVSSSDISDLISDTCTLTLTGTGATTCTSSVTPPHVETNPHVISGAYSADNVHSASSGSANLTVTQGQPVIAWSNPADITYGTALSSTQLNATASYLSSRLDGIFAYTPAAGTVLGAGSGQTLSVTFTPTDAADYLTAASSVQINVNKATATVVVTPYTVTYDGNAHTATVTSITGVNGETGATVGTVTLNTTHTNAGTYASDTWSFTGAANYNDIASTTITDTINKATATVVVTPYTVTYDGNAHTATGTAKGVESPTPVDLTSLLHLGGTTHTNASDYPADAWTFDGNNNYNATSGTTHDAIAKANAAIAVTPYSVTYDGNAHTATGTAKGVESPTPVDLTSLLHLGGTTHTDASDYPADAWTFDGNNNYNATSGTTHDAIAKANAAIAVTPYSVTYDGNAHTATGTAKGVESPTPVDLTSLLHLGGTTHTNASDYPADAWTFDGNNNYNATSGTTHDAIAKANAAIAVTPYSVTYDGNAHTATGTAKGVESPTPVDLTSLLHLGGTTHTNASDYPADAWTFDGNNNYNATSGTTHDAIAKANAAIAVTPYSVTYDGNAHTATGTAKGVESPTPVDLTSLLHLGGTTHTDASDYPADAWTFDGNNNYNATSGTTHDAIAKANAAIAVTPYSVTYDGNAHTATGTAKGVESPTPVDLTSLLHLGGTTHTDASDYPADAWTFDGNNNYNATSGTTHDAIAKANAAIAVTPYSVTYDGNAHTATGTAKGVESPTPVDLTSLLHLGGTTHTNASDYPADAWTFDGNNNYNAASGTVHDVINKATPTVTVGGGPFTYDATAHAATATATGVNNVSVAGSFSFTYTPPGNSAVPVNAGTYGVSASFTSNDANYTNALGSGSIKINPATPIFSGLSSPTIVLATATTTLSGTIKTGTSLVPPGSVAITVNSMTQIAAINPTTGNFSSSFATSSFPASVSGYPITYSYTDTADANFNPATANGTLNVHYASGGMCDGDAGHQILQPINADGTSVFKQGSTTPAKFRVCDANGQSIGNPGVVVPGGFVLYQTQKGTITNVDEVPDSTTPDTAFRWDPTGQQWIFNISTKYAPVNVANQTYYFRISLNDGTSILFQYGLK